jgi:glutaredoxin-like YruB-family protein
MEKSVKVYSTPICPYCIRAKQFLKENAINYTDIDVSGNPDAAEEMIKLTGQMGVPVIDIDGEFIVGFDKDKIKKALGI